MRFRDRVDAGERLGEALAGRVAPPTVVLGVPRGGVIVAAAVGRILRSPVDVVVPKKLAAPGNPELGLGAVAPGVRVLDERLVSELRVTPEYLEHEIESQEREIARREDAYRKGRRPVDVEGKLAIVVDDGVATGGTAVAACRWARKAGAARVILAVPVAPRQARAMLEREADQLVVLATPDPFYAVGQWYRDFDQVSDQEVVSLLQSAPS
jgi:putative phosphoribosyl transferase